MDAIYYFPHIGWALCRNNIEIAKEMKEQIIGRKSESPLGKQQNMDPVSIIYLPNVSRRGRTTLNIYPLGNVVELPKLRDRPIPNLRHWKALENYELKEKAQRKDTGNLQDRRTIQTRKKHEPKRQGSNETGDWEKKVLSAWTHREWKSARKIEETVEK